MSLFRLNTTPESLPDGLYEDVLSDALARAIDAMRAPRAVVETASLADTEASTMLLARTVEHATRLTLDTIDGKDAVAKRLALVNEILALLTRHAGDAFRPGETALRAELLLELVRPTAVGAAAPRRRPLTGLELVDGEKLVTISIAPASGSALCRPTNWTQRFSRSSRRSRSAPRNPGRTMLP
jgi:hypothetical protein